MVRTSGDSCFFAPRFSLQRQICPRHCSHGRCPWSRRSEIRAEVCGQLRTKGIAANDVRGT
eukprot:5434880-Prymnesium_polylepis.1